MKLYRTGSGVVVEHEDRFVRLDEPWDAILNRDDLFEHLHDLTARADAVGLQNAVAPAPGGDGVVPIDPAAPIASQEVWAAGVTYWRSRAARMEESKDAGGGSFYDRVYEAQRPELFFKAAGWRVRGPGQPVRIRRDSRWSVPEPELVLCANARGEVVGVTIGNDMSSRDIEGENPLYLPQAKIYDGSCALGPCLLVTPDPLPPETPIRLAIRRGAAVAFEGETSLARMRREPAELVRWLFREITFPAGAYLFTGTGIVPPDDFTLRRGDAVRIEIPPVGVLENPVA